MRCDRRVGIVQTLEAKIWMTCEPSMYSSKASMDSRSCGGEQRRVRATSTRGSGLQERTSTSRKMETPGMSRESWRLMVAH